MTRKSICVYCGSREGRNPAYAKAAQSLGTAIAEQGHRLVYGAGDVGLMGLVANAASLAGGNVFGVIPEHLMLREIGKLDITRFIVTENMHERKKVMFMNADIIVTIPGGAGSLDELYEALTWKQIGLHDKPILILNTEGYWNPLLELIDHQIEQGFADPTFSDLFQVFETVPTMMAHIESLK
ncbi:MAG: TIGR00730 family Rossman fold protein [Pseudomonadota bacterium]